MLNGLEEFQYLKSKINYIVSPTIAGLKPASLINFNIYGKNTLMLWRKYNRYYDMFSRLKHIELFSSKINCQVLFYDSVMLQHKLKEAASRRFLKGLGYSESFQLDEAFSLLGERYKTSCPHELGIFLGYPVKDVEGFIKNNGKNYLYCGYWKVYYDLENALKCFESFDKVKQKYLKV